jgi:hypothetical protein
MRYLTGKQQAKGKGRMGNAMSSVVAPLAATDVRGHARHDDAGC